MKVIIAGSRTITDKKTVFKAIHASGFDISEVICGGARGVDRLGERWAYLNGKTVTMFMADWDTFGKSAGYIRNEEMAGYAEALILVWDGKSKGSGHMRDLATIHGLDIFEKVVK